MRVQDGCAADMFGWVLTGADAERASSSEGAVRARAGGETSPVRICMAARSTAFHAACAFAAVRRAAVLADITD